MASFNPPSLFSSNMQTNSYQKPHLQIRIDDSNLPSSNSNTPSSQLSIQQRNSHNQKFFQNASHSTLQNFQLQNQIFELKSTINNLAIKKENIMSQLSDERRKNYELSKSKKLLEQQFRRLVVTNQQLERINQNLRQKLKGQSRTYQGKANGQSISFSDKPKIMTLNRLKQSNGPNEALMQQNLLLRRQNQRLSKLINELQNQNKKYVDDVYTIQEQKRKLMNVSSEQKSRDLFQLMISHEESLSKLRIQIKKANEQYEQARAQAKFERQRNNDLQARISYYRKQVQKNQQQLNWKIQNPPNHIDAQSLNEVKLKQQIKRKTSQIQDFQIQLASLNTVLKNQQHKLFLKQKQNEKQAALNNQLSERIRQYEKQYRELQEVYFKQERTLTNIALQKDQLTNRYQSQIKSHKAQLDSFRQQHQTMVNDKNSQLYRLQERIKMLDFINQNESEKRKSECLKKEMNILEQENINLKEELRRIQAKLNMTVQSVEKNDKQQRQELQAIQRQFSNAMKSLQKKNQEQLNATKNLKICEQQVQRLKGRLREMEKQLNQQQSRINQYSVTIQKQKEQIKCQLESEKSLNERNQRLKAQNKQLNDKCMTIQDMYGKLQIKYKKQILDREEKLNEIIKQSDKRSKSKTSYKSSDQSLGSIAYQKNSSYDSETDTGNRIRKVVSPQLNFYKPLPNHFKPNKGLNLSDQNQFRQDDLIKANQKSSQVIIKNEDSYQPTRRIVQKDYQQKNMQVTPRAPCTSQRLKNLLDKVERDIKSPKGIIITKLAPMQQIIYQKESPFDLKYPKYSKPSYDAKNSPDWNYDNQNNQNKHLSKVPTIKDLESRNNFNETSGVQLIEVQPLRFKDSGERFNGQRSYAYNSERIQGIRNNDNFQRDRHQRVLSTNRNNQNVRSSQKLQVQYPITSDVKPLSDIQKQKSPIMNYLRRQSNQMLRNEDRPQTLSLDDKIKKIKQSNNELRRINHLCMDEGINQQKIKQVKNQAFRNFQDFNLKNKDRQIEVKHPYSRRMFA